MEKERDMEKGGTEAQKYVWEGAIPLQVHLHDSEVTTLPTPPPLLVRFLHPLLSIFLLLISFWLGNFGLYVAILSRYHDNQSILSYIFCSVESYALNLCPLESGSDVLSLS